AGGYVGFTLARYAICLAVMLPATFCAGITLPLIIRILLGEGVGERAVGAIYGWNTLGSIVGVAAASLVLLPRIRLEPLLAGGAGTARSRRTASPTPRSGPSGSGAATRSRAGSRSRATPRPRRSRR